MQGKAIWRQPDQSQIFQLVSGEGNDEFIIAPYSKTVQLFHLKGQISSIDSEQLSAFFQKFKLLEIPNATSTTEQYYQSIVNSAVNAIEHNQFEKVVLARQFVIHTTQNPELLFQQLVEAYPHAFVYCFNLNNGLTMLGATPETLLERKENTLSTQALGGTEQVYGYTEKEYQEHRQIITDISNKLLSQAYTFKIGLTSPKKAGTVSHLSTPISIHCKNIDVDMQLVNHLHPTAAIGGLPFDTANLYLKKNEDFDRRYYAGYLGLKQNENFSFYVNLRCAELYTQGAILFAGAGINGNSIAADEWLETTNKLNTLLRFMN